MPALKEYRTKRNFRRTPEPRGERAVSKTKRVRTRAKSLGFVVQKHAASRLHYDFRLELDGVLKSWAVPKGPSLVPGDRRLAVEVEDHPIEYGTFEGTIPQGEYGGGSVLLWDRGSWIPRKDPREGMKTGRLEFDLDGEKLRGGWILIRMKGDREAKPSWLLMKERDRFARNGPSKSIVDERPESVSTGRTIEEIGRGKKLEREWSSSRPKTRGSRLAERRERLGLPEPSTSRATAPKRTARESRTPSVPVKRVEPQLATLVRSAPEGDGWLHEIKYDGYRALAVVRDGRARILTRSGQDWTVRFQEIADEAAALRATSAILDGEVVVLGPDGRTSFQALQNSMRHDRDGDLVYFVFDLLERDGRDLRRLPLEERKEHLRQLLAPPAARTRASKARSSRASEASRIRYSDHVVGQGTRFYTEACGRGLEGIVSKRRDAPYRAGRGDTWLKVKCSERQEFVIGGFTEPQGSREGLGALLLGLHEGSGSLRYVGRVGTGFTRDSARELRRKLDAMEVERPPFRDPPRGKATHWVRPKLVAEVSFTAFTDDGKVRHPSFQGLREDKPASEARRERPRVPPKPTRKGPPKRDPGRKTPLREPPQEDPPKPPVREPPDEARPSPSSFLGVRVTHPDRVLDPESGATKGAVAAYVAAVAGRMLPHVAGRPLMILRCPEGRHRECFFQKHPGTALPPGVTTVTVRERAGMRPYLSVDDASGLVGLVQVGAIEVHVWGSRADREERPDRIVFDLDPDPSVPWAKTVETAHRIRDRLEEVGLTSFAKTTGGKGIHVVVPIRRGPDWAQVAAFSSGIASEIVRREPDRFTTQLSKTRRRGRILIDTLRNRRGATWVAPYSPRAREGIPVSTPVSWAELTPRLTPARFTFETVPARMRRTDPWAEMGRLSQTLTASMLRKVAPSRM